MLGWETAVKELVHLRLTYYGPNHIVAGGIFLHPDPGEISTAFLICSGDFSV